MKDFKDWLGPVVHVVKKEIIEMRRTKMIGFLIIAPILQAVVFGLVATTDITDVPTLICDEDNTAVSRDLAGKFMNNTYFRVTRVTHNPSEITKELGENREKVCVRIPNGLQEDVKKLRKAQVQLIGDGTDSNSGVLTMARAQLIIMQFSNDRFKGRIEAIKKTIGALPQLALEERVWYNPELKSSHMMVPGVMGLILAVVTLVVMAISIVREKEAGNMEQMIVTPITPSQIIAGKIIPYTVIGLVDVILVVVTCGILFKTPFEGSFLLLLTLSMFMILVNLGIGIFISTVSATQQQAMFSAIFFLMPNILLSGFIFPIKNMPEVLQWLTYLIPMRYYMVIIRGIFLKGLGFYELLPQTLALFLYGAVIFTMAISRFRKTAA